MNRHRGTEGQRSKGTKEQRRKVKEGREELTSNQPGIDGGDGIKNAEAFVFQSLCAFAPLCLCACFFTSRELKP